MTYTITIPGHTARENELLCAHWTVKHALRQRDDAMVLAACENADIPPAKSKRRVSLTIVLAPRQRRGDAVCPWWKSLLDALVNCGRLFDDSLDWCEVGPVTYVRSDLPQVIVELEDLEGG